MKLTILGCGPSVGVPSVNCTCAVCSSSNPYNKRLRTSAIIQTNNAKILIDTGPDIRQQALLHNINYIDAVIYTHAHADHINGIDDLRAFKSAETFIPIYSNQITLDTLQNRSSYMFKAIPTGTPWRKSFLTPHLITYYKEFDIKDLSIMSFPQEHGEITSIGLIFGNKIAYCTDVKKLPEQAYELLSGVEVLVIECIGYNATVAHAHFDLTLSWIAKIKPKLAIMTHMSHEIEYDNINKQLENHVQHNNLPTKIVAAYDGYSIEI